MAAETQLMMDTCSPSTPPAEPSAVGYFIVPPQGPLTTQLTLPVTEGESTIGRDDECDVPIPVRALSRRHAILLVEEGEHFIMDLGSRNCTYRRGVKLKPERYYELTSGVELVLADVKCQYFIGQPPTNQIAAAPVPVVPPTFDQAQPPTCEDEEGGGGGGEEEEQDDEKEVDDDEEEKENEEGNDEEKENDQEKENEEKDDGGVGDGENQQAPNNEDEEATQAYALDDEAMECEPITLNRHTTALMDSPPSSPLLGATTTSGGSAETAGVIVCDDGEEEKEEKREEHDEQKDDEKEEKDDEEDDKNGDVGEKDGGVGDEEKEGEEEEGGGRGRGAEREGEREKKPARTVTFTDVRRGTAEDSGSETEGETETERETERETEKGIESCDRTLVDDATVPYQTGDVSSHDDGAGSDQEGPFDGCRGDDEPTVRYDIVDEEEEDRDNNKQESKQQQDVDNKQQDSSTKTESANDEACPIGQGASTVAPGDQQTLIYDMDTEIDRDSESEVRSKVNPANTPSNLASEGSHTADIASTSSIKRGKNHSAPAIKSSDDESHNDSGLEEHPVPIAMATNPQPVVRATRSRQKTLMLEAMRVRSERGRRGRKRGSITSSIKPMTSDKTTTSSDKTDSAAADTDTATDEATNNRGQRRRGRGGRGRKPRLLSESSEEQTTPTATTADNASSAGDSPSRERDTARERVGSSSTVPPPTSAVSVVRRIVEGMTLKSAESRAAEVGVAAASTTVGMETVGMETVAEETVESPNIGDAGVIAGSCDSHVTEPEGSCELQSPLPSRGSTCDVGDDQSDRGSVTSSGTPSVEGERGRGRRRGVKRQNTPRNTKSTPKLQPRVSRTPESSRQKPKVMFTGVVDKDGEETVRMLGGEMVDSVYNCTHLVTDKVRRTVKFLCCLARGCHIVNDQWLGHCREEGRFLATDSYLVKDRTAERQHKFSLAKSLELARCSKLLSHQRVFLSPSIKPPPSEMADIVTCSGGQVLTTLPHPPGVGLLIVASPDDLSLLSTATEVGVAVHSTELILGGILKQELDLTAHQISVGGASSSGPAPSHIAMETVGGGRRKRRKTTEESDTSTRPSAKRRRK